MMIIAWILFLLSAGAQAGQETHGGDVVVCEGKTPIVLDYYHASLPGAGSPKQIENIEGWSTDQVIQLFRDKLKLTYFGEAFERSYEQIGDLNQWVVAEGLKDIKDDGLKFNLPEGCDLLQGAVREGSAVYIEKKILRDMEPSQLGMLVVHEILYKLAVERGQETSARTRQVVRLLMQQVLDQKSIMAAVNAMGWEYGFFEIISAKPGANVYYSTPSQSNADYYAIQLIEKNVSGKYLNLSFKKFSSGSQRFEDLWLAKFRCDYFNRCYFENYIILYQGLPSDPGYVVKGDYLQMEGLDQFELHYGLERSIELIKPTSVYHGE